MSKHQIGYTVFGVFTLIYVFGFIIYDWWLPFYLIFFLLWGLLVILGSFVIRTNYHLNAISSVKTNERAVALTFDDGPTEYTIEALNLLKRFNCKGTFFCIGNKVNQYPEIVENCFKEGHDIGNHTFSHSKLTGFRNTNEIVEEITQTDHIIESVIGVIPKYFRPPFGVTNPSIMRAVKKTGHTVIGWNVRSLDTVKNQEDKIFKRIVKQIRPGSIILLHDTSEKSIHVLERLLNYIAENNFRCVTVEELLKLKR